MMRKTVEQVEAALILAGLPVRCLDPGFVPYWLRQGKSVEEIVEIATGANNVGLLRRSPIVFKES